MNHPGTKIPDSVDLTRWSPDRDRKGKPLKPGDRVRVPTYSRGFTEGVLELSKRTWTILPDGDAIGALSVVDDDGKSYNATGKTLLIKTASNEIQKLSNQLKTALMPEQDHELRIYAVKSFKELYRKNRNKQDIAQKAAYDIARYAAQIGINKTALVQWVQRTYGSIWLRELHLDASLDFKIIRQYVLEGYNSV
jgi:hypothetical protein